MPSTNDIHTMTSPDVPAAPLRYRADFETPEPAEEKTGEGLTETMLGMQEKTFADTGHAMRAVHAKSHGILHGGLRVHDALPPALAQGLFSRALTHPVILRLSTNPADILDDSVSTPRGLALKVLNVEGERLPGSESDTTQDFLLVNGPVFVKSNAKQFLGTLKLLAATTDKMPNMKKVISAVMRGAEKAVEALGAESPSLLGLGGQPATHLLGETFYTQVPFLYGEYMAKLSIAPVSPELIALTDKPLDVKGKPNALREAVADFFRTRGGRWELRVQLCTDIDVMPIEDAKTAWPEDRSPYIAVATIEVPAQSAWTEGRSDALQDRLSFSPWHGLAAHRPLGSLNRLRKEAYEMAKRFRAEGNRQPIPEPRSMAELGL